MATITLGGTPVKTVGELPQRGHKAEYFNAVNAELENVSLQDFEGHKVIMNIFPSIDTGVCAASVRMFHQKASELDNVKILCISKDLPFALKRFCGAENIDNLVMLSDYKGDFSKHYQVSFSDGPLQGLLSRSIIVLDEKGDVLYTEQVAETKNEPNYQLILDILK